jgi:hypothetical protein
MPYSSGVIDNFVIGYMPSFENGPDRDRASGCFLCCPFYQNLTG